MRIDDILTRALAGLSYVEVDHSCVARCAVQDPPLLGEVSGCFARILGESHDSGCNSGLDALAILRVVKKDLLCILETWHQI